MTALVAAGAVALLLETTSLRLQHQTLGAFATTLAHGVRRDRHGWTVSDADRLALSGGGASFSFAVIEGGTVRSLHGLPPPPPTLAPPSRAVATQFRRVDGATIYSGLTVPIAGVRDRWIVVVQDLEHPTVIFDDIVTHVVVLGAAIILILLAALLAIDVVIVRRSLAPIRRASRTVQAMRPHETDERIDVIDLPSEVLPLALAANAALERVTLAYRTERDFITDTAHALRTPLAVLRLRAEDISDSVQREPMLAQIDQLRAVVAGLLTIAEIDATAPKAFMPCDLRMLAVDRAAEIAPLAIRRGQSIEVEEGDPMIVLTEPDYAARALEVLLENAVLHTPRGTSITILVGVAAVTVMDDGPGIDPSTATELFERFRRGVTESNGTGLGLSVAARLMEQSGGTVRYQQRVEGGSLFTLLFTVET
ncbi:HAMP domain-containing histidine kinase [Sphingomonas sp. PAMC26645]|nr:HAMP domain-containing histidine kinase [Sphingomonas sp. PAMC26645]